MLDPKSIQHPSDLKETLILESDGEQTLELSAPRKFGFDFHWLRETGRGRLDGDLGLQLRPDLTAGMQVTLTGRVRRVISLDEQQWIRLQVFKRDVCEFEAAASVSVAAQPSLPSPQRLDELAMALLGIHEAQWLRDLKTQVLDGRIVLPESVERSLESLAQFQSLDPWVRAKIEDFFGRVETGADLARLSENIRSILRLKDRIYDKAISALEKKWSAEAVWQYQSATLETALIDGSFDFTADGLEAYRQALDGRYSAVLTAESEHIRLHRGILTHMLRQESRLEVHLPLLGKKEWSRRLDVLAKAEVETGEDGRLLVYHVEAADRVQHCNSYQSTLALAGALSATPLHFSSNFTLSYADKRTLKGAELGAALPVLHAYGFGPDAVRSVETTAETSPRECFDLSLSLSVPGTVVAAWLNAPGEREPAFTPAFVRVASAAQQAMRVWLPYVYFDRLERYETLAAAFPLLVYQASRPFNARRKMEFTYDVMNDDHLAQVYRSAERGLTGELARIHRLLRDAGKDHTAAFYHPSEARAIVTEVARKPLPLQSLLAADSFFVDALINLGCQGRELRETAARDPQKAVRRLMKFAAGFAGVFHGKLRRLYGGRDFLPLGSMLLVEATAALSGATLGDSGIQAVLHLGPAGREPVQTFVNGAYRP